MKNPYLIFASGTVFGALVLWSLQQALTNPAASSAATAKTPVSAPGEPTRIAAGIARVDAAPQSGKLANGPPAPREESNEESDDLMVELGKAGEADARREADRLALRLKLRSSTG